MLTLEQAYNVLHLEPGSNDELIESLLRAAASYISNATGIEEPYQCEEPLCDVATNLLLTQWYFQDKADDKSLTRTLSAILKSISQNTGKI